MTPIPPDVLPGTLDLRPDKVNLGTCEPSCPRDAPPGALTDLYEVPDHLWPTLNIYHLVGSRVAQHLSARGVTTVPGSDPGCITMGRVWESHRAAHNWPSVIRVWLM